MLPLVVVGCIIKAVCQSVREATTASGVDNAASPDWQTPLNGIISPSERGWSLCKNNWKEPRSILMSSVESYIDGVTHAIIVSNTHALPAEYKCSVNKTEQSIYECLLVSVLTTFSGAATNFGCIDSFLLPNSETKKWWVMVSLCYCCRFTLNSKRLLSTSCNKQGQRSSE